MKKVVVLIMVAVMIALCGIVYAENPSITTDTLTNINTQVTNTNTTTQPAVEAVVIEADIDNAVESIAEVINDMELVEMIPVAIINYEDGAAVSCTVKTVTPLTADQAIAAMVGTETADGTIEWTEAPAKVVDGEAVVEINAELLAKMNAAVASYIAILFK